MIIKQRRTAITNTTWVRADTLVPGDQVVISRGYTARVIDATVHDAAWTPYIRRPKLVRLVLSHRPTTAKWVLPLRPYRRVLHEAATVASFRPVAA